MIKFIYYPKMLQASPFGPSYGCFRMSCECIHRMSFLETGSLGGSALRFEITLSFLMIELTEVFKY